MAVTTSMALWVCYLHGWYGIGEMVLEAIRGQAQVDLFRC